MILIKTVILKIRNPDKLLVRTIKKYTKGMNYVSGIVYKNKTPMPVNNLQPIVYDHLRKKIGLKSQMSCNIVRQVLGTYRSLKRKSKWMKINYRPTNITYSYNRDFTINKDKVSITTVNGRKKYKILNYNHALQYFDGSWKYSASSLVEHKDGNYYFHLCIEKEINEPDIIQASNFMGVDVGINFLAVATTTDKKNKFFCGGEIKNIRNIYSKQRRRLQEKGTHSAKRVLKTLSEREKRLMWNVNHIISKKIVEFAIKESVSIIGLEDLNGIKKSTWIRKEQRHRYNKWAFRQLQTFIEYKAMEKGILVQYIDPRYTSKTCSRCGHINNRNGLTFKCNACDYEINSDLNGARNIERKTRDFRHDLESQGCIVDHPDGNSTKENSKFLSNL